MQFRSPLFNPSAAIVLLITSLILFNFSPLWKESSRSELKFKWYDLVHPQYPHFNGLEQQLRATDDGNTSQCDGQSCSANGLSVLRKESAMGDMKDKPIMLNPSRSTTPRRNLTNSKMLTDVCVPPKRIVFLKTHKTASSTTASIFQRYGFSRNWTFAVGSGHVIARNSLILPRHIYQYPRMKENRFDILTNHARYNRETFELLLPNATYVTILRKPEDQLESAFSYFAMYKGMKLKQDKNPFKTFMEDPYHYYEETQYFNKERSRNGQLFDLGFSHKNDENETKIEMKIAKIDNDFDLVMISEYYDQSLILLKELLCLDYDDIVYIPKGVRGDDRRFAKDDDLIERIIRWNYGDFLLYQHFNKTLWKKITDYGPSFQQDLEAFRRLNQKVYNDCVDVDNIVPKGRAIRMKLKTKSKLCKTLIRRDTDFTKLIRKMMEARFGKHYTATTTT